MRRKIVAANWKMNLRHEEVKPYLDRFLTEVGELTEVEVILIPSFTSIPALAYALGKYVEGIFAKNDGSDGSRS